MGVEQGRSFRSDTSMIFKHEIRVSIILGEKIEI